MRAMVDELTARAPWPDGPEQAPAVAGDRRDDTGDNADNADDADTAGGIARPPAGVHVRIWRRIVRRPMAWIDRPWPTERIVRFVVTALCLGGTTWAALQTVHPDLVFTNNTPTGGDMGAHVMGPAFLRDVLLPNFQLSGVEQLLVRGPSRCTASTW
jgi:hypothetical protein